MSDATAELVALLDLEDIDTDLFRGAQPPSERARVYGGQVAAQSVVAGSRTVDPEFGLHSLHSYFLLPGDYSVPIVYDVERIRDGRSFQTRRIVARQHGRPIYYQTANFQRVEDGLDHQDVMPSVGTPEDGVDLLAILKESAGPDSAGIDKEWASLEIRYLGDTQNGLPEHPEHPARAQMWIRINGELGDDPIVHLAAFTYASDISLLGASLAAHTESPTDVQMASLDHALWFHRPFRADQWWLYDQWSPSASGGRGFSLGRVFTEDGTMVASAAQEGLIRPRRT